MKPPWLRTISWMLLCALFGHGHAVDGAKAGIRPNILFAIADDWGLHASAYGTPWVKTPAVDRVAREGILFNKEHLRRARIAPAAAIRSGDWKLIEWFEDGRAELFNLRADPGEVRDLAGANPEMVKDLRARLHTWQREVGALATKPNPNFNPSTPDGRG